MQGGGHHTHTVIPRNWEGEELKDKPKQYRIKFRCWNCREVTTQHFLYGRSFRQRDLVCENCGCEGDDTLIDQSQRHTIIPRNQEGGGVGD